MKTKIAFNDIPNVIERDEMKQVLGGGYNSIIWGNSPGSGHFNDILPLVMEDGGNIKISFSFGGDTIYTFSVPKDTIWGGQLNEVIVSRNSSTTEQTAAAVAFGWDLKTMLSQVAIGGDAAGMEAQYLSFLEKGGYLGLATSAGLVGLDIAGNGGVSAYNVADLGTQALIYGAISVVPVAGWALGAAYFLGNYYTERNYSQGLYEHLNPN